MKKRCLCIIPARGGSKGIPKKNLRMLDGKPLIAWTVEAAKKAKLVDRVIVSTDDAEIAAVSKQFGAEVVMRPAEISGDAASSESALLHVLDVMVQNESYKPDILVFLQCTSPLTLPEDIDGTIQAMLSSHADTTLAVTSFHYFLWRQDKSGNAVGVNHDKSHRLMRQEREHEYKETGSVYVMRTNGFLQARHRFFGKTTMYVLPQIRCLEIDEPADLVLAEALLGQGVTINGLYALPGVVAALVLDFDGVLTDNRVWVDQKGCEAVLCNRSDGMALAALRDSGIPVLVLSSEINPVVKERCAKLGQECIQGVANKETALREWLEEKGIDVKRIVYVGNDINDIECMKMVGCGIAVSDAHPSVKKVAKIVLEGQGGQGAVREVCDLIAKKFRADK